MSRQSRAGQGAALLCLPKLNRIPLRIAQPRKSPIGIFLRIDLHVNPRRPKLRNNRIEITDSKIDHPHLLRYTKIIGLRRKRRKHRRPGRLLPRRFLIARRRPLYSQMLLIPLGKRRRFPRPKKQPPNACDFFHDSLPPSDQSVSLNHVDTLLGQPTTRSTPSFFRLTI